MGILSEPRRYAPPASLWPLVADTDRFSRDTGLPPVQDLRGIEEDAMLWRVHALK